MLELTILHKVYCTPFVLGENMVSFTYLDYHNYLLRLELTMFKIAEDLFARMRMKLAVFGLDIKQRRDIDSLRVDSFGVCTGCIMS